MTSIRLELPEPPSINQMLVLAGKRSRRTRNGGWTKKAVPMIVYDQHHEAYELQCLAAIREQGIRRPPEPWPRWRLASMHFRLHNERDWLELAAGAKWAVDFLVRQGFVAGDSPREMERPECWPTQEVARKDRGLVLVIERAV